MIKPYYQDNKVTILNGHVITELQGLAPESVHMSVLSPPYWGLRDYGLPPQVWSCGCEVDHSEGCEHKWGDHLQPRGQSGWHTFEHKYHSPGSHKTTIGSKMKELEPNKGHGQFCQKCNAWRGSLGLEPDPELYIQHIVQVFREIWRVLRGDGTCWLNIGDSYASGKGDCFNPGGGASSLGKNRKESGAHPLSRGNVSELRKSGLKPKDLCMIPTRVALALQADGWWLRSDIIWSKPNPMPESVTDRPTRSHEYVFLLTKSAKYFYDADAVREPHVGPLHNPGNKPRQGIVSLKATDPANDPDRTWGNPAGRNLRSVWTIATQPFPDAHFATFPEKLVEPCIKAGTSEKGCCPECGASWVRVIDYKANYEKREPAHAPKSTPTKVDSSGWKEPKRETIGWRPSCECRFCPDHCPKVKDNSWIECYEDQTCFYAKYEPKCDPIPCTVLDPFGGSGRTAIVAKKLGRRCIIIELKGEYCEMPLDELRQENIF